ncbi:MAG: transcription antitermination factor NusB [Actinomycetota bacterium]
MKRGVEARVTAATLLTRIVDEGAYSNVVIRTGTRDLERRDALFVQHLVYGAIRNLGRIDRVIEDRVARAIDDVVRSVLRIAVGEILFGEDDAYAAVDSAVEAVRELGAPRAAGFVNGVLRNVVREGEPPLPEDADGRALGLGIPTWLLNDLSEAHGEDEAAAFLEASNQPSRVGVRRRTGPAPGEGVEGIDDAFLLEDPNDHRKAIASGSLIISDPASTAVAAALEPQPGDRVLDMAAAPGGKTLHLWDLMEGRGPLVAMDRHERRTKSARRRIERLGADVQWVIGDAAEPPFAPGSFDRILLDAPCTGLGTLRRRPEIRHRLRPESAEEAGRLQRKMLEAAIGLLGPGGRLVYSVCTVTPDETTGVIEGVGLRPPDGLPGREFGGGILLAPHITGSDGMFIAVLDR